MLYHVMQLNIHFMHLLWSITTCLRSSLQKTTRYTFTRLVHVCDICRQICQEIVNHMTPYSRDPNQRRRIGRKNVFLNKTLH